MKAHTSILSIRTSSGYTLIELLVAMTLGLFLMTGVFQLNSSNQKTSRLQDSVAQTQKNGRFAIDSIAYAVKTAGYSGYYKDLSAGVENVLNTPADIMLDASVPVSGFNNINSTDNIAGVTGFIQGTDVLLLKSMNQSTVPVLANPATDQLNVDTAGAFSDGDILVVSDLDQASVFQVNTATTVGTQTNLTLVAGGTTPGNATLLANSYTTQAEVGKLDTQMFYIKNGQNGTPSLFKTTLFNNLGVAQLQEIELTSDIKNMQILYSVDTNNDNIVDLNQDASAVVNWNQVIGINVALLATSNKDNVMPEKSSFTFDTNLVTFNRDAVAAAGADRRLKRVFRSYMRLRNRVL